LNRLQRQVLARCEHAGMAALEARSEQLVVSSFQASAIVGLITVSRISLAVVGTYPKLTSNRQVLRIT
jgi:hypothetical protein